jgi:hypothetical protein
MYADHCPLIADFALQKPENLFKVGLFVQCTINQHFEFVPGIIEDFESFGFQTKRLMRWQKHSIKVLLDEQERLHMALLRWRKAGRSGPHKAIRTLVELPGYGIAKAAFFAQLLLPYTHVGCLDRHNLRLAGLAERAFGHTPTSVEGLTRKINTYLGICKELGGSKVLWDTWCNHLAQIRPYVFASGEVVSRLHVECIMR